MQLRSGGRFLGVGTLLVLMGCGGPVREPTGLTTGGSATGGTIGSTTGGPVTGSTTGGAMVDGGNGGSVDGAVDAGAGTTGNTVGSSTTTSGTTGSGAAFGGEVVLESVTPAGGSLSPPTASAFAAFYPVTGSSAPSGCAGQAMGACCLVEVGTASGGSVTLVSAGTITLTDRRDNLGELDFASNGYGALDDAYGTLGDWNPGDQITVAASGDTVAAFTAAVTTPLDFAQLTPPYDTFTAGPVLSTRDLVLTWQKENASQVTATLTVGTTQIVCSATDGGSLTVPHALLAQLGSGTGALELQRTTTTSVSGRPITLSASTSLVTSATFGTAACGNVAWPCQAGTDCCSGTCTAGACAVAPVGGECKVAADCTNQNCVNGACACKTFNDTCSSNADCCTGNCQTGHCKQAPYGGTCTEAADCAAVFTLCRNGTCSCLPAGSACTANLDCCTTNCYDGQCALTVDAGGRCETNADCTQHQCDTSKGHPGQCIGASPGTPCVSPAECLSDSCNGYVCQ